MIDFKQYYSIEYITNTIKTHPKINSLILFYRVTVSLFTVCVVRRKISKLVLLFLDTSKRCINVQ